MGYLAAIDLLKLCCETARRHGLIPRRAKEGIGPQEIE